MIQTIRIVRNDSSISQQAEAILKEQIRSTSFQIKEKNPVDLVIAIGGDGTFLEAFHRTGKNYSSTLFLGIHTGHLGFLQEFSQEDIAKIILSLENEDYNFEELFVQAVTITEKNGRQHSYYSFNDVVIKEKNLKSVYLRIWIENQELESFAGDGVIVSTPIGSTAYNMSVGGSIIHPSIRALQITPIAPINSNAFHTLRVGTIIPGDMSILILPDKERPRRYRMLMDGRHIALDAFESIKIEMAKSPLQRIKLAPISYFAHVRNKFL